VGHDVTAYSDAGLPSHSTTPEYVDTTWDLRGRPLSQQRGQSNPRTNFTYDTGGRLRLITEPLGNVTHFNFGTPWEA
jgi:YD repeat-containing protein